MSKTDPIAVDLVRALRAGDLATLGRLLAAHPGLAAARPEDGRGGSSPSRHAATDWPGHFPHGARVVALLIAAGADPNAPAIGSWHAETPLRWAAGSDDTGVATAPIEGGADLEAVGASIGGGMPLDDAVGYGRWQVAGLLVDRGARVDRLWQAGGAGHDGAPGGVVAADPAPGATEISDAFWQACHGGQPRAAATP